MTATITFDNTESHIVMTAVDLKSNVVERCILCNSRLNDDESNVCQPCEKEGEREN